MNGARVECAQEAQQLVSHTRPQRPCAPRSRVIRKDLGWRLCATCGRVEPGRPGADGPEVGDHGVVVCRDVGGSIQLLMAV